MIRLELTGEPHQLEVAAGLLLEAAARREAIEIAVDVDLEQGRRMIGRAACGVRENAVEPQSVQVELLDKSFDSAHRIVGRHIVVQALRKQGGLPAVFPFNETLHAALR